MNAISISGDTFLEAMFQDALPGTHTVVTAFKSDPSTADRMAWCGRPWSPGDRLPSWYAIANAYLTISTFDPDPETGELRRRKANFSQIHAVMIDDIGVKVPRGKLRLPPSAMVETSPGNHQGWLFIVDDADARDRIKAETLIDRMVAAGLTADGKDPGMRGVTRYGRLPIGINSKRKYVDQLGHVWPVRCTKFEPATRYSISLIAEAFELDLTPARPIRPAVQVSQHDVEQAGSRFGALIQVFSDLGLYKGQLGNGWHAVTCPWIDCHTDRADSGTAIAEPSENNAWRGGFRCHHGHCEGRGIRDVHDVLRRLAAELNGRLRGDLPQMRTDRTDRSPFVSSVSAYPDTFHAEQVA